MVNYPVISGLVIISIGIILILFRKAVSKFLSITMIKGVIRPEPYEPKKGSNLGVILLGIFFIIVGLLLIFYPEFFSMVS